MAPFFVLEDFIAYLRVEKRFSGHTLLAYRKDVQQFLEHAGINSATELSEVRSALVRGWMVDLLESGLTSRSVNRKISSLRTFFKFCVSNELLSESPMQKVKAPKVSKRLPSFVKEKEIDVERMRELFADDFDGERDRLMFELLYQCGLRLSELIGLREDRIERDHIRVLGKRNKERIIPISPDLYSKISAYRERKRSEGIHTPFLLALKNGNNLYPKLVYRRINYYLGSLTNLDKKSPHVLRHTFATHMLNNGAGLETLKDLLGHANLSATQVYTHNSFRQLTHIYSQAHPRGGKKT